MQSIDSAMNGLISKLDLNQAKALRIAQNNQQFEQAIRRAWNDNPTAAEYLLAHVNGIYFKKDDRPRKGPENDRNRFLLGIYFDDSMAKSELNARREILALILAQEGIHIDEIVLHSATWGMRERHLFPHAIENLKRIMNPNCAESSPGNDGPSSFRHGSGNAVNKNLAAEDQSRMLETFKRACCQAFVDYERAWLMLSQIEGAELVECRIADKMRTAYARYWCNLYAANPERIHPVLKEYESAIISKASDLGLKLHGVRVCQSRPNMRGMTAFPRQGAPIALCTQPLSLNESDE